jgi:hypothetical protein
MEGMDKPAQHRPDKGKPLVFREERCKACLGGG